MRPLLTCLAVLALAGCGGDSEASGPPPPTSSAAPSTLPDGRTPTAEEAAFLAAVTPALSDAKAQDPLDVLNEGGGLCRVYLHPSDPAVQQQAVEVLVRAGWTQSDAWTVVRGASEHLCPGK